MAQHLSLEDLLEKNGVRKSEPRNRSGSGGYPKDVIGTKIVDMPEERQANTLRTNVWITDKCIVKAYAGIHWGRTEYAYYHEEIFGWDCDQKYKDLVLSLWKKPDYDGYLSKNGEKLKLKLISQNRKSKL